jgi:hypothetical protein
MFEGRTSVRPDFFYSENGVLDRETVAIPDQRGGFEKINAGCFLGRTNRTLQEKSGVVLKVENQIAG